MQTNTIIRNEDEHPSGHYGHVDELKQYQQTSGLSWAEIARKLDVSPALISQYIALKYKGDSKTIDEKVAAMLHAEAMYQEYIPHITDTVMTAQVREVMGAIEYVQHRSFGLFVGEAGIGKTQGLKEYARQNRSLSVMITLDPLKDTKHAFTSHLYSKIPGNVHKRISCSQKLDDIMRYFNNTRKTLVIDEAHFLKEPGLEAARSIQDQTGIGVVLTGTFRLDEDLGFADYQPKNAQLYSRVKIHRVINPTVHKGDLLQLLALYNIYHEDIADWLLTRCNKPGRRYRWVVSMVEAAYTICRKTSVQMSVNAIEQAEKLTGLL